jgi:hypothetical protein
VGQDIGNAIDKLINGAGAVSTAMACIISTLCLVFATVIMA